MNTPTRPELMAPAGSPDAGFAALHYGADAVYLGLSRFSARAEAANFSMEAAGELIAYAHSLVPRRRVFATLNTLILQQEIPDLTAMAADLAELDVDAVIAQDLGVARLLRRQLPGLRLHASTQMACHNRAGVEILRDMGFSRVTLARELTLEEIRSLSTVPGVETEIFIHGALCYSYSGLCLYSSQTLGRSGNRGRCAYLCRDSFQATDGSGGFLFSMKDLSLAHRIAELAKTGAASFKIEGRMKAPLYVAATTRYYRGLLDGTLSSAEREACEADIRTIFSRPWTELHLDGRRPAGEVDPEFIGHRGAPIGRVLAVTRRPDGRRCVRFRTARPLELHDGIQIETPGEGKPYGFAVDRIEILEVPPGVKRPDFFEAPAHAMVELPLPSDAPLLPEGAAIFCSSSQEVKRRYRFDRPRPGEFRPRRPVRIRVDLAADGATANATAPSRCGPDDLSADARLPGPFQPARTPDPLERAARGAFEKLGDTPFQCASLDIRNPNAVFVPVSQLNALRRDAFARLDSALEADRERLRRRLLADCLPPSSPGPVGETEPAWSLKTDRADALSALDEADWSGLEEVVIGLTEEPLEDLVAALDALARRIGRERIRLALPLLTRSWEERDLTDRLRRLHDLGWARWEAAQLSGWRYLDALCGDLGNLTTDWSVYVTNTLAARDLLDRGAVRMTLSPEDGLRNMAALLAEFADRLTVPVYQDTPLFLSESCVRCSGSSCPGPGACDFTEQELVSSHGDPVIAINRRCRTILLNRDPYCLADRLPDLKAAGARHLRVDFIYRAYRPEQVRDIWRACRSGRNPGPAHTGNFDRGMT